MSPGRGTAIAATVLLHLALWWGWLIAQQRHAQSADEPAPAMQWVELKPFISRPAPQAPAAKELHTTDRKAAPVPVKPAAPLAEPTTTPTEQPAEPVPEPAGTRIIEQARRDIGTIDRELRKQSRGLVTAPVDSPQLRMQKGIARAAEMVPNKWYETPKVEELVVAGAYSGRRYRVVGHDGTYCVTYETNHALDGIDTMKDGIKPKFTNCPKNEQPATKQE